MRYKLSLIVAFGVDHYCLEEVEDQHVDCEDDAEEMVVVLPDADGAHGELGLVDIVAEEQVASVRRIGQQGLDSRLVHRQSEVGVELETRSGQQTHIEQFHAGHFSIPRLEVEGVVGVECDAVVVGAPGKGVDGEVDHDAPVGQVGHVGVEGQVGRGPLESSALHPKSVGKSRCVYVPGFQRKF